MPNSISRWDSDELDFATNENQIIDSVVVYLQPENDLERKLISEPEFLEGLFWGIPRFGHPEGKVIFHVKELYDNIDRLPIDKATRSKLRLIALVHDTFKIKEHRGNPRDWNRHHAVLARQFLENFTDKKELLDIVEYHDEAYYIWILIKIKNDLEAGQIRLNALLEKFKSSLQLYYLFFKCDTLTGDKNLAPIKWFEKTVNDITIVDF